MVDNKKLPKEAQWSGAESLLEGGVAKGTRKIPESFLFEQNLCSKVTLGTFEPGGKNFSNTFSRLPRRLEVVTRQARFASKGSMPRGAC